MSMADKNEQIDEDILQSKADVLRAHDIIPATNKRTKGRPASRGPDKQKADPKDPTKTTAESANTQQTKNEIPQFDLAEEIMAEQRKVTAVKRKAPDKKPKPPSQQPKTGRSGHTIEPPQASPSYESQIVAEIVARDIENLRRSNNPADSQ